MADKPKTYPQKIQELQEQLELKDNQIAELLQLNSFIDELKTEVNFLKQKLSDKDKLLQSGSVNSKAQNTDLLQRAESAEQGLRNLQSLNKDLQSDKDILVQQLDILGLERDKNRGKDDKINLLAEELKAANMKVAALNQQLRDTYQGHNELYAKQEKEVLYLRQLTKAQKELITALTQEIEAIPYDGLAQLRKLAKNG